MKNINLLSIFKQIIPLDSAWNLISFQVKKCFYQDTLPTLSLVDMNAIDPNEKIFEERESLVLWLLDDHNSPIRDANDPNLAGDWQMITSFDRDGAHLLNKDLPLFINTLNYISFGYGYWVKMNKPGVLIIERSPIIPDISLNLQKGWNLMGYMLPYLCYAKEGKAKEQICPYSPENGIYKPEEGILLYTLNPLVAHLMQNV